MKPVSEALAKAARHRQWHWCRRPNGFSDWPRWRVMADRLGLPLPYVLAFVNRLEEFANEAGNKGYGRGEIAHFNAEEFGMALGISENDADRIYGALEAIGWIVYGQVSDFYERNPDREDETGGLRQRRFRARAAIRKTLSAMGREGRIVQARRTRIETGLSALPDAELFALVAELQHEALTTAQQLSTGNVTSRVTSAPVDNRPKPGDAFALAEKHSSNQPLKSFPHVTRDTVTVTPEQSIGFQRPVENSGNDLRGNTAGSSEERKKSEHDPQAQASLWLSHDGVRIVRERLHVERGKAETNIARWRDQDLEGAAVTLCEIIQAADKADYMGDRFYNLIVDGIRRAQAATHPQLPLPPVLTGKRTGNGHA
jgi:hypothetical protein